MVESIQICYSGYCTSNHQFFVEYILFNFTVMDSRTSISELKNKKIA